MTERTLGAGRYVLLGERPLGTGGMGTVWKAFDKVLHREVAVKELRIPEGLNSEEQDKLRMRALREARAAAGLDHPAIVTIHDVVDEGGRPWIVMQLLPGQSLDQVVRANGPLSPRRAAELGVRLVEALGAAHANGVLHRDVKPQNVMLGGDDRWMLTDFGIASVAGATRTLTGTGIVTGTLGYVAPERLSGAEPGTPADLWALGATLYFAVEGRNAYEHDDLPAMIAAVLTRAPDPMRLAGPLAPVITALMQRDPAHRPDAQSVRSQLLAIAGGYPTFETPITPDHPTQKLSTGTKPLHVASAAEAGPAVPGSPVVRAITRQLVVVNGAVGAFLGMVGFSLSGGMPLWIAGVMAGSVVIGGVLGKVVARGLGRWLGLPTAVGGSALLIGEAILAAGIVLDTSSPVPAAVLCAVALFFFGVWHRSASALRKQVGAPAKGYRRNGVIAAVVGLPLAVAFVELGYRALGSHHPYLNLVMALIGGVVAVTALASIPALRGAPGPRAPRAGLVVTVIVLLLIPVLVGVRTVVFAVQGLDDFKAVPTLCSSTALRQEQIAKFVPDPPDVDESTGTEYVDCEWAPEGDEPQLTVGVWVYDNEREAAAHVARERRTNSVDELTLGDEAVRYTEDYSSETDHTVEVRLDNLVLEVELDQPTADGEPDTQALTTLAATVTADLQAQHR